jgi:hypothetical protein
MANRVPSLLKKIENEDEKDNELRASPEDNRYSATPELLVHVFPRSIKIFSKAVEIRSA